MLFYLRAILLLSILLFTSILLAQNDTDQYFDDGGISDKKNIVKVDVAAIVNGDLPIFYERAISPNLSLEVGVGLLLPYYLSSIYDLINDEDPIIDQPQSGFSLWVHPKYYYSRTAPEGGYFGLQYRRRQFNQSDEVTTVFSDISMGYGGQAYIGERFTVDYSLGLGYRYIKEMPEPNLPFPAGANLILPMSLKLGIRL